MRPSFTTKAQVADVAEVEFSSSSLLSRQTSKSIIAIESDAHSDLKSRKTRWIQCPTRFFFSKNRVNLADSGPLDEIADFLKKDRKKCSQAVLSLMSQESKGQQLPPFSLTFSLFTSNEISPFAGFLLTPAFQRSVASLFDSIPSCFRLQFVSSLQESTTVQTSIRRFLERFPRIPPIFR